MYCTYITVHPETGLYYAGKAQTERIAKGYMGSGIRLHCAWEVEGYEKETWVTTILEEFETEDEAFAAEAELVPPVRLFDPLCLNDTPGGRTGYGRANRRALLKRWKKGRL